MRLLPGPAGPPLLRALATLVEGGSADDDCTVSAPPDPRCQPQTSCSIFSHSLLQRQRRARRRGRRESGGGGVAAVARCSSPVLQACSRRSDSSPALQGYPSSAHSLCSLKGGVQMRISLCDFGVAQRSGRIVCGQVHQDCGDAATLKMPLRVVCVACSRCSGLTRNWVL